MFRVLAVLSFLSLFFALGSQHVATVHAEERTFRELQQMLVTPRELGPFFSFNADDILNYEAEHSFVVRQLIRTRGMREVVSTVLYSDTSGSISVSDFAKTYIAAFRATSDGVDSLTPSRFPEFGTDAVVYPLVGSGRYGFLTGFFIAWRQTDVVAGFLAVTAIPDVLATNVDERVLALFNYADIQRSKIAKVVLGYDPQR